MRIKLAMREMITEKRDDRKKEKTPQANFEGALTSFYSRLWHFKKAIEAKGLTNIFKIIYVSNVISFG